MESPESDPKGERLHKLIAASGLCSRRKAEKLILEGRVKVCGKVVTTLGAVAQSSDEILVDDRPLPLATQVTVALHKPKGFVTTMEDRHAERTVAELLRGLGAGLKPVGRLDKDTEGLLICTSDGALAHRLAHPRYAIEKEYEVTVRGWIDDRSLKSLESGVVIEGRKTAPARVESVRRFPKRSESRFHLTIHEGRKRQIRLMCRALGFVVLRLRRVRIGPVRLGDLKAGAVRRLSESELRALRSAVGLQEQGVRAPSPVKSFGGTGEPH